MHPYSYPNVQLNKLSGRYIYNNKNAPQKSTSKALNTKQLSININDFSEKERLASMGCSCVKSPNDTRTPKERNYFDFSHSSATNVMVKEPTLKVSQSQNRNYNYNDHLLPIPQSSLEKLSSDLNLKRIAKQSPLSPLNSTHRYDKANMAFYDHPQRPSRLAAQDNQNKCHYTLSISKSEQTSPNNMDIKKTTFTYDNNKRSASSLLYVSSMDPWTKKSELQVDGFNQIGDNGGDPWIKRSVDSYTPTSRNKETAPNGHVKSFSSARRDHFIETKKSNYLQPDVQRHPGIRNGVCVASAPPSPHFLKTINDALGRSPNEGMQIKSASFSPARGRNLPNPFGNIDIDICDDNGIRKTKYVAEQPRQAENSNHNLSINNPKRLQNRHSFSTISEQSKEELQLNIRRLSEQMRQMSLKAINKFSLSDCNVSKKGNSNQSNDQEPQTVRVFRPQRESLGKNYTDSKEISKSKESYSSNVSTILGNTKIYASCQKSKSMQETTC